jgi:hypothetical protein
MEIHALNQVMGEDEANRMLYEARLKARGTNTPASKAPSSLLRENAV